MLFDFGSSWVKGLSQSKDIYDINYDIDYYGQYLQEQECLQKRNLKQI